MTHAVECLRETITPAKAARYLKSNVSNRPLARGAVRNYADEIAAGQWLFNGEAIKFDWNGDLVDGQHRLAAVVHAGKAIDTFVVRGLDPAAFKTLDTGKVRSSGDVLAMHGVRSPIAMATAYRALYRFLGRGRRKSRISNTQLLEMYQEFPDLIEHGYACMVKPLDANQYALSTRVFFYYVARGVDAEAAHGFMSSLARPDQQWPNAAALNARLTEVLAEVIPPAAAVRWCWLVQAWNATIAGKRIRKFSRMPDELIDWKPKPTEQSLRKRR